VADIPVKSERRGRIAKGVAYYEDVAFEMLSYRLSALLSHNILKLAGKTFQYDVLAMLSLGVFAWPLIQRSFFANPLSCASMSVLAQDVVEKIGINSSEKCGKSEPS